MPLMDLSKNEFQHPHAPALAATGLPDEDQLKHYPRLDLLRRRLAEKHGVPEENLFLQPGGAGALQQIFLAHGWRCGGSGTILLPELTWQYYEETAERVGCAVIHLPMIRTEQRYDFDIDAACRQLDQHPETLIVLTLPNNPSGSNLSAAQLDRICRAAGPETIILIDEVYHGFAPAAFTPADMLRRFPNTIVLRTFSKLYGMAGARIAYMLAGDSARQQLRLVQPYLGTSTVAERLAFFCMDNQDYYDRVAKEVVAERERMFAFLNGIDGCECFRSDANFLLMHAPGAAADYVSFLSGHGVEVRLYDRGKLADHVRITVGTPAQMETLRTLTQRFFQLRSDASGRPAALALEGGRTS
jgi:histidinol-phosphate aminotransferase